MPGCSAQADPGLVFLGLVSACRIGESLLPERFFLGVTYIWLVVVAWLLAVKAH
jgi:hypothetical protein